MSTGNLEGTLVSATFWPACHNCVRCAACAHHPQHPAYPHTWHWGREFAVFADGYLITRSWVGSSAIGQPHTGCTSYEVDPRYISEAHRQHRRYLELEQEKGKLESEMQALERKTAWTNNDEAVHARLLSRFRHVLQQHDALRSMTIGEQPVAAAGNA